MENISFWRKVFEQKRLAGQTWKWSASELNGKGGDGIVRANEERQEFVLTQRAKSLIVLSVTTPLSVLLCWGTLIVISPSPPFDNVSLNSMLGGFKMAGMGGETV